MKTRAIIVATDGTTTSTAAVLWAAREAHRRDRPLRVVHAFDWEFDEARYDIGAEYIDVGRQFAEAVVANAIDQARTVAPRIRIEGDTLIGHAAARLLAVADSAELMVLGNRGRGGFTSLLLGSVSRRVATHAPCPVVIVRGHGHAADGPVAVGVDDSPAAEHVLETSFEAASGRGCGLTVVHAYLPTIPLWLGDVPAADVDTPDQDADERARLEQLLTPWRSKYPEVPVETMLSHDSAAAVLVGVSHKAQLVIVGSHNHGVIAGTILGSTSMQLLHHADCPVYITRPHHGTEAAR